MSKLRKQIPADRLKEFFTSTTWYHVFDLGDGVVTRGTFNLRDTIPQHHFPDSLAGKSVLDVASSDGYYSFEFEKRGAESVLAIDTNLYDGSVPFDPSPAKRETYVKKHSAVRDDYARFKDVFDVLGLPGANKLLVMADYLDSKVAFKNHSVYELDKLGRQFDLVMCGALMEHLKDPLKALEQLRVATRELCVITLSSALPQSRTSPRAPRMRLASLLLSGLGVRNEFSINGNDRVLRYVGNVSGGSFFQMHPDTFREMALASGFRSAGIAGEYTMMNHKHNTLNHNVVFHCRA